MEKTIKRTKTGTEIKDTREDVIFNIITLTIMISVFLIIFYPIYFVVIASISDPYLVLRGDVILLPKAITFASYQRILDDSQIWVGYRNSLIYTFIGTVINITLTMGIAFPLSRKYFSGRKVIMIILLISMYFSGGMIPTYLLVNNLGMRNSIWAMVILGGISVYNVIIARSFLEGNIPTELEEATEIDGCTKFRFFFTMVLPLSKSILAVLTLYYAVAHWNDYMRGMIYLDSTDKYPLQLVIRTILIQSQIVANDMSDNVEEANELMRIAESMKYGVIIVSTIPTLILYPFIQKHFVKGVMIGSVKG